MVAEPLRPYVVELRSRENTQFRRVNLLASSRDEAAARIEALEAEYTEFQLTDDKLGQAQDAAIYIPRDTDLNGRFHRAGKVIRGRGDHSGQEGHKLRHLRAGLGLHHQEKPYAISRVGDTRLSNVLASMYGLQWQDQIEGGTNRFVWASDTIKVSLHTSSYTPAVDTDDFFNDATNELSTANGYTAGGATLGSKTSTYDTSSDQIRLDGGDVSWTSSTLTARHAVIWVDTAGASTADPVIGFVNFESDVSTTNGTFQITWDATGIFVVDIT